MSNEETMPSKRTGRGGVEVRVIGGGMGDPRIKRAKSLDWIEDEIAEDSADPEQVVRLGGATPLANRRLEDEEPASPAPEQKKKRKLGLRGLTILMACAAVFLVIAGVMAVEALRVDESKHKSGYESMRAVDVGSLKIAGMLTTAEDLVRESTELLTEYSKVKDVEGAIGMIRNGEQLRPLLKQRWKPIGEIEEMSGSARETSHGIVVGVTGTTVAGDKLELILVPTENGVKFDWEASLGIGEVEFTDLKGIAIGRNVTMRVLVEPSHFHPLEFPDDKYRAYRLSSYDGKDMVFGYARLDSHATAVLSTALNEGSILLDEIAKVAMIVRLRNDGRGEFRQFTIADVKQEGWIEP